MDTHPSEKYESRRDAVIEYGSPNVCDGPQATEKRGIGFKLTDTVPAQDCKMDRAWLTALISRFLRDEGAATAIGYGLIAAGIAVAIIPVITGVSTKLRPRSRPSKQRSSESARVAGYAGCLVCR